MERLGLGRMKGGNRGGAALALPSQVITGWSGNSAGLKTNSQRLGEECVTERTGEARGVGLRKPQRMWGPRSQGGGEESVWKSKQMANRTVGEQGRECPCLLGLTLELDK